MATLPFWFDMTFLGWFVALVAHCHLSTNMAATENMLYISGCAHKWLKLALFHMPALYATWREEW